MTNVININSIIIIGAATSCIVLAIMLIVSIVKTSFGDKKSEVETPNRATKHKDLDKMICQGLFRDAMSHVYKMKRIAEAQENYDAVALYSDYEAKLNTLMRSECLVSA